jgi:hypothetical protein
MYRGAKEACHLSSERNAAAGAGYSAQSGGMAQPFLPASYRLILIAFVLPRPSQTRVEELRHW